MQKPRRKISTDRQVELFPNHLGSWIFLTRSSDQEASLKTFGEGRPVWKVIGQNLCHIKASSQMFYYQLS